MKQIEVTITRIQTTTINVPDDFELSGEPQFNYDQMLQLQAKASHDTVTTDIHAVLLSPTRWRISAIVEGVTEEQAITVASERFGFDEDYGFDYTLTDEGNEPA